MSEENKALMQRFISEYQTNHDDAVLYELVADDFVDHSASPGLPPGREGVKAAFDAFHAAFAGFRAQVHDQVAENDRVVTRKSFHGRHIGEYLGVAPTDREVRIDVIDIVRIADGRIVEHWNAVDQLGFLRQLGALPS
ncbi:MAG TPA: ester cyclase [Micromonosporaceae bacterium]|nr:ester cyclase [Micromonosporaceae bacterium]